MNEFVTVATFNFPHEIIVLKSVLNDRKIEYFFQNENIISINPLASYAYGGIKLKVHPNHIVVVKEILENLNTNLDIV